MAQIVAPTCLPMWFVTRSIVVDVNSPMVIPVNTFAIELAGTGIRAALSKATVAVLTPTLRIFSNPFWRNRYSASSSSVLILKF